MVDIQSQIFNSLKQHIEQNITNAQVQKDFQSVASRFPTITFYEIDNSEFEHTLDYKQRYSNLAFQIDIFTIGGDKESQARNISSLVNEVMGDKFHMKRIFSNQLSNADKDIYRYTMRYSCKIDEQRLLIYS